MTDSTSFWSGIQSAQGRRNALLALIALAGLAAPFLVPYSLFILALSGISALLLVVYAIWCVFNGCAEPILLGWVLLFPLGYYFLSYPAEHSVVTLDRVVVALLSIAIAFTPTKKLTPAPLALRHAALAWGAFLVAVAVSMIGSRVTLYKVRLVIDALVLPALLGWYVVRSFPVRSYLRVLHLLVAVMATYSAGIGVAEMLLKRDLMPIGGVEQLMFTGALVRPHGPVTTPHSFALIGMFTFCFLLFLYRAGRDEMPLWQHILHRVGVFSALACGSMPLFRGVLVALVMVALLDLRRQRLFPRRLAVISLLTLALVLVPALKFLDPVSYEERASPVNLFLRIAQSQQTLVVFLSHPLTGIGFASYDDAAAALPADLGSFGGIGAADSPHNVIGSVVTETGVLGLIPFVASQIFLVIAFLRLRRLKPCGAIVWPFFLSIFIIYWVMGMDSTTFQYSDLNLSFIFAVACLYKYGLTESPTAQALALRERGAA